MQKFHLMAGLLLLLPQAQAASFDCLKAGTRIEKMICADKQLGQLDSRMAALYGQTLTGLGCADYQLPAIKAGQLQWLKTVRDACTGARCLKTAYQARIKELAAAIASEAEAPAASENPDGLTGSYRTRCYGLAGLGGGALDLKELGNGQVQFALDCNRGAPSFNMGMAEGTMTLDASRIGRFVMPKDQYAPGGCELVFDLTGLPKLKLEQNGDPAACGFGGGVVCSGTYGLKNRQPPNFAPR